MIGREDELAALLGALDSLEPGGRVVVVEGEPGIGKTTLVDGLASLAAQRGLQVIRCAGGEGQLDVGFAAVHELLHPLLGAASNLPARHRRALLTAFGELDGGQPDPLLINLAALGLLEDAASSRPLVVVVEDLHWVDRSSIAVLDFVARRLGNAPILMVATLRPAVDGLTTLSSADSVLRLEPLDDARATALVAHFDPLLSDRLRERVVAEAAGNPLAIREFSTVLAGQDADRVLLPARLPTSRRLEQSFLGDFASLPDPSRQLLLLASADDARASLPELLLAGRDIGITLDDLGPIEHSRLVSVHQDHVVFGHPLVRSAVYGAASTTERAAAHRRLAAVTRDPVRAVWHRAAATLTKDEATAAELTAMAHTARQRGALPEAVAALRRAAALSPAATDRIHRLAVAAEYAREAGAAAEARDMLDEILPVAESAADVNLLVATENMLAMTDGMPARSLDELLAVAASLQAPTRADTVMLRTRVLGAVVARAWTMGADDELTGRIRAAARRLVATEDGGLQHIVLTLADPVSQAPTIRPRLAQVYDEIRLSALVDGRERGPGTSQYLTFMQRVAESVHDLVTARRAAEDYLAFNQDAGTASDEATALQARSMMLLLAGDLAGALADCEQSIRLSELTSSPRTAAASAAVAALVHALRGASADALHRVRDADELSGRHQHALISTRARWAAGLVAMGEGRYSDAWLELSEVSRHPSTALWALADRVEAGARAGRTDAVRTLVAQAEEQAEALDAPFVWAIVHRARAILTDGADPEEHYLRSIEAARRAQAPFEAARSHLALGEWLRRRRRIIDARVHLKAALSEFERVGAVGLVDRTAAELRAAGSRRAPSPASRNAPDVAGNLTPQELQIVRLAASGLSNKEIADHVYLSHRTVGAHLYRAFPKLGVTTRAQLADLLRPAAVHETT
jgi:DNA-binding NarL/FixJ family response regulator